MRVKDFDGVKRVGHSKATRQRGTSFKTQVKRCTALKLYGATIDKCQALRPEDQLQTLRFNAVLLCLSCDESSRSNKCTFFVIKDDQRISVCHSKI